MGGPMSSIGACMVMAMLVVAVVAAGHRHDAPIASMGKIADEICACKSKICSDPRGMREMAALGDSSGKPTKAQMEKAMKIAERMTACQRRIMAMDMPPPPPPPPPVSGR